MTRDEFETFLTPERKDLIWDCVKGGLADYDDPRNYGAAARRDHTPSIRASIRNGHIVARAKRRACEMQGIHMAVKRNRVLFVIADRVQVSFKKLDKYLRSKNNRTRQALDFLEQRGPITVPLPNFEMPPELTNVVAGYLADDSETDFEIRITCPNDQMNNRWDLKLMGAEVAEFLSGERQAATQDTRTIRQAKRVKIRPDVLKQDESQG